MIVINKNLEKKAKTILSWQISVTKRSLMIKWRNLPEKTNPKMPKLQNNKKKK